jgi:hypothetical protein
MKKRDGKVRLIHKASLETIRFISPCEPWQDDPEVRRSGPSPAAIPKRAPVRPLLLRAPPRAFPSRIPA